MALAVAKNKYEHFQWTFWVACWICWTWIEFTCWICIWMWIKQTFTHTQKKTLATCLSYTYARFFSSCFIWMFAFPACMMWPSKEKWPLFFDIIFCCLLSCHRNQHERHSTSCTVTFISRSFYMENVMLFGRSSKLFWYEKSIFIYFNVKKTLMPLSFAHVACVHMIGCGECEQRTFHSEEKSTWVKEWRTIACGSGSFRCRF